MTKADLIKEICEATGLTKTEVSAVVESFMTCVKSSLLERRESVHLRGFGSFMLKHRAVKTARNISKNTTLVLGAYDRPYFKPAKEFMEKVREETLEEIPAQAE